MPESLCQTCGQDVEEFGSRFISLPDGTIVECERCPEKKEEITQG